MVFVNMFQLHGFYCSSHICKDSLLFQNIILIICASLDKHFISQTLYRFSLSSYFPVAFTLVLATIGINFIS